VKKAKRDNVTKKQRKMKTEKQTKTRAKTANSKVKGQAKTHTRAGNIQKPSQKEEFNLIHKSEWCTSSFRWAQPTQRLRQPLKHNKTPKSFAILHHCQPHTPADRGSGRNGT
jgi:hypothetical protein